jgi:hypothetical protein
MAFKSPADRRRQFPADRADFPADFRSKSCRFDFCKHRIDVRKQLRSISADLCPVQLQ